MQIDHLEAAQCRHHACECAVESGEEFCSEHCRNAADNTPLREGPRRPCGCGHAQCADAQQG